MKKIFSIFTYLFFVTLAIFSYSTSASAVTLEISAEDVFRETRFNPPPFFAQGDNFLVSAVVTDLDTGLQAEGATVTVTNSNTGEVTTLEGCDFGCDVFAFIPYTSELALGNWTFTATLDGNTVNKILSAYGTGPGTGPMPGVENLAIPDNSLAPTFSWTNPASVSDGTANDGNVDRFRIRITDLAGSTLYDERQPSGVLNTTSFTIPSGIITEPGVYVGQVLVEGFTPFIRSRTFEVFEISLCDIQMSQATYVDGDTVTANVFRFANPTSADIATEWKVWLGVPGINPISIINLGADGSFVLPAGADFDLGPLPLLPVNAGLPRGDYEFGCRMLDPTTGELLWDDLNTFDIQ